MKDDVEWDEGCPDNKNTDKLGSTIIEGSIILLICKVLLLESVKYRDIYPGEENGRANFQTCEAKVLPNRLSLT